MDWIQSIAQVLPTVTSYMAVLIVAVTTLILLLSSDWRLNLAALAVQYFGVFILILDFLPIEMATVKLVAGLMAAAILGMAITNLPEGSTESKPIFPGNMKLFANDRSGRLVALFSAMLVWLIIFTYAPRLSELLPGLEPTVSWGGALLVSMGLLQLGFSGQPMPVILALLTILAGFEVLYASVETSTLLAGLLAAVNLFLALVGAYLILAPVMEPED
jgi:hypothetical protein